RPGPIGAEKAGSFGAGRPAVLGTPEMPASVAAAIESLGARAVIAERDFSWRLRGESWDYEGLELALRALPPSALAGSIQYRNAATALAAVEALARDAGSRAAVRRLAARLAPLEEGAVSRALRGGRGSGGRLAGSRTAGWALARAAARRGGRVVVFGSVHAVGPALEWLRIY